jgi:hypothetical protein
MESHDEERLMFKNLAYGNAEASYSIQNLTTALARMELAGAFFFTIPGPKMIWQFGELGYDFSIDENGRVGNKPIRWDYNEVGKRKKIYQIWAALIGLKQTEPAFSTSDYTLNLAYSTKRIELNHVSMDVRMLGNFEVVANTIDPNFSKTGTWYDYFSGESFTVDNPNGLINLDAGEYRIFTSKKLDKPEITVNTPLVQKMEGALKIYPVPASDELFILTSLYIDRLSIYDINGKIVLKQNGGNSNLTLDVSELNAGIYFLRAELQEGRIEYLKFAKN